MAYKVRKEGGIGSSLMGMLFGIVLVVFASPIAAWYAESQQRAEDFTTAVVVALDSSDEGYVVVEGDAVPQDTLGCPYPGLNGEVQYENKNDDLEDDLSTATDDEVIDTNTPKKIPEDNTSCVYVNTLTEAYSREEKEVCGRVSSEQTIIQELGDECDADGTNCEPCYMVEQYDWSEKTNISEFAVFTIGDYEIIPEKKVNFIGTKEFTEYEFLDSRSNPSENDLRFTYTYLPADQTLLVAGDAENNSISSAYNDKPYIISSLSYEGTLEALEAQDSTAKWGLRIASLVMMVLGFILIVGPLTLFTNVFRFIPFMGKRLDKGIDSVIIFIAAVFGFLFWLLVWGIVLVMKNIFVIILFLTVIGIGALFLVKKGKKLSGGEKPQNPQEQSGG